MTELNLWLERPNNPPVSLKVGDNIQVSQLKAELIARSQSPRSGPDGKLPAYEVVSLRTGTILRGDTSTIAYLVRDGDRFILREASGSSMSGTESEVVTDAPQTSVDNARLDNAKTGSFDGTFGITGIAPFSLDFTAEYSVLAVAMRSTFVGTDRTREKTRWSGTASLFSGRKPIYVKEVLFLMAAKNGRFKWVSPAESSYYTPDLSKIYPVHGNRVMTRYGVSKNIGENKTMIYPVRPFSITGISMEGFDPAKGYPVLAIDIDQYIKENPVPDEIDPEEPKEPQSQSLAFFLVGDDNGEFAWIAEDECRLYPLKN